MERSCLPSGKGLRVPCLYLIVKKESNQVCLEVGGHSQAKQLLTLQAQLMLPTWQMRACWPPPWARAGTAPEGSFSLCSVSLTFLGPCFVLCQP